MGLERFPDAAIGLSDYVESVDTAVALGVNDQRVRVYATTASFNITLPPVGEAKGKIYSIVNRDTGTATYAATIIDQGDAEVAVSIALDADDDYAVLYSDGISWFTLVTSA